MAISPFSLSFPSLPYRDRFIIANFNIFTSSLKTNNENLLHIIYLSVDFIKNLIYFKNTYIKTTNYLLINLINIIGKVMIDSIFHLISQEHSLAAGQVKKTTIKELPDDVMLLIFQLLETQDLNRVSLIDKHWNTLTKNDLLWKALLQRDTNFFKTIGSSAQAGAQAGKTWKEIYQLEWLQLPDNTDFVRRNVLKNGLKLKAASDRLKDDFDTVKLAVLKNKEALNFASDRLRNSPIMKRFQSRAIAKKVLAGGVADVLLTR